MTIENQIMQAVTDAVYAAHDGMLDDFKLILQAEIELLREEIQALKEELMSGGDNARRRLQGSPNETYSSAASSESAETGRE